MSDSSSSVDQSEIRLMGLILMQSMSIGIAVSIFDSKVWIDLESVTVNGFTYAMGAFFVQGLAYYVFKMFFQHGMDEKARSSHMERERRGRYRGMEEQFDRRRQEMELRMQEAQLNSELEWMEGNPGKMPASFTASTFPSSTANFVPAVNESKDPLKLGVSFDEEETVRGSDGKFKKKE
tara:strand:+ start:41 stop:577 length:537 start_codon:yes stop_codon:yes gene_type:complete